MNETLKTIFNRKSVRVYQDKLIDTETLEMLVRAGIAAPSGADTRSWEFIIVNDKKMLHILADNLKYGKMLKNAGGAIVVCAKPEKSVFEGDQYWLCDGSAATENILLAAESLGLGAVWVSCYPNQERIDNAKKVLSLPKDVEPLCVVSLGYPKSQQEPKDKYDPTKIHWGKW